MTPEKVKIGSQQGFSTSIRSLSYGYNLFTFKLLRDGEAIAEDYGLVYVNATPLRVSIAGGPNMKLPFGTNMTFDGSASHDPDVSDGPGILSILYRQTSLF